MADSKKCEKCGNSCSPVTSEHNPKASEFYCSTCHKSYLMTLEEAQYFIMLRRQSMQQMQLQ